MDRAGAAAPDLLRRARRGLAATAAVLSWAFGCVGADAAPCNERTVRADHAPPIAEYRGQGWTLVIYTVPWRNASVHDVAIAADGAIWYADTRNSCIGRLEAQSGRVQAFATATGDANPHGVAAGAGGEIWYAATHVGRLGRLDPVSGRIREYALRDAGIDPHTLIAFDGAVWFTAPRADLYGRLDPGTGDVQLYSASLPNAGPYDLAADGRGSLWTTLSGTNAIGRIDAATTRLDERTLPDSARPVQLAHTGDGRIWYTDRQRSVVARLDPRTGDMNEFPTAGERAFPRAVAAGSDGRIWYSEDSGSRLVALHPVTGSTEVLPALPPGGVIRRIIRDDVTGDLWLALSDAGAIGRVILREPTDASR